MCNDDKLIELATIDGKIHKNALDIAMKFKKLTNNSYFSTEFLLKQCGGNYKRVNELIDNITTQLDNCGLEIRHSGSIGIKNLDQGVRIDDPRFKQFNLKHLANESYSIEDILFFCTLGKGKYIDSLCTGNIAEDLKAAFGCRALLSPTEIIRMGNMEDDIAALISHTLHSNPTPIQRTALGEYKGDGFLDIQLGKAPELAKALEEYLSNNPLKKSIKVIREDDYDILNNLKFADGVTLKDAITNPKYFNRLSDIKTLEGQSFINDRFMSTAVGVGQGERQVNWEFEVSEGVGATYLDTIGLATEREVLLNKDLKITIVEINEPGPGGVVRIKAKVEKADTNTKTSQTPQQ